MNIHMSESSRYIDVYRFQSQGPPPISPKCVCIHLGRVVVRNARIRWNRNEFIPDLPPSSALSPHASLSTQGLSLTCIPRV